MKSFRLTVSSPDGNLFSGEFEKFDARGVEGDFAVMAGHVPFVTSVVAGICTIHLPDGTKKTARTQGGLVTVSHDEVIFLAGTFRFEESESSPR